jgi:hypothetical protein
MRCAGSERYWTGDHSTGAVCPTCGQGWRKLGVKKRPKVLNVRGGGGLWTGQVPEHDKPPVRRNQGGRRIA